MSIEMEGSACGGQVQIVFGNEMAPAQLCRHCVALARNSKITVYGAKLKTDSSSRYQ